MIQEKEILDDIQKIREKTYLLSNPLYNDAGGSTFWNSIDKLLEKIEYTLKDEIYRYTK